MEFLNNLLELCLEAAPWLVLGLVIGGLIKALIPTSLLQKHLSGNSAPSIVKAALFGAPLPLCSCGVIPAALGLRRAGASKSATVSFLVATPETGIDSVSVSYALLGPFMAIVRPIAAIVSAITAGLLVGKAEENESHVSTPMAAKSSAEANCCGSEKTQKIVEETSCCGSEAVSKAVEKTTSCCSSSDEASKPPKEIKSCCDSSNGSSNEIPMESHPDSFIHKAWNGVVYSFTDLFDKVLFWLVIGLVFAALVQTFVPVTFLAEWGSGLPAMLLMLVVGIPMYVCATASTPIAAGLLLAGVSPGTAMVFLMAGPATNISTLGVIGKELGKRSLIAYLSGVTIVALITGFLVDYLISAFNIDVQGQISHSHDMVPAVIAWASLLLLVGVVLKLKLGKSHPWKTQTS
ncbi:SO_0444 family Cu/Zn efflux transporter [Cocleimonas sp. KMM 6892]|uniref:SO_0444 family Cu/Zn efflux transporter n=1 Tax=unclassified Cocleimonas TaxID=2639732 RepID=UPI002DB6865F|nr:MULTISPECIES: SO_0444 family Cu/Zn efflux transporter [unclassified Cocleimonas]MEB8432937.1 SO_0444 family Cu/Zn efflux transporter [Cocleimonas sp. KMM 6892]MEC4716082.1 SO_0444 family Cu/Zn efflux transporter [Cocleimonas sp. KMM 6895]MEC4745543.1 SO_0444 family Cu/Zn efflux transporter [Cocleimonas sp. KMM 6896]